MLVTSNGTQLIWFPDPVGARECELSPPWSSCCRRTPGAGGSPRAWGSRRRAGHPPGRRDPGAAWGAVRVEAWAGGLGSTSVVYGVIERTGSPPARCSASPRPGWRRCPTSPPRARHVGAGPGRGPGGVPGRFARRGVKAAAFGAWPSPERNEGTPASVGRSKIGRRRRRGAPNKSSGTRYDVRRDVVVRSSSTCSRDPGRTFLVVQSHRSVVGRERCSSPPGAAGTTLTPPYGVVVWACRRGGWRRGCCGQPHRHVSRRRVDVPARGRSMTSQPIRRRVRFDVNGLPRASGCCHGVPVGLIGR